MFTKPFKVKSKSLMKGTDKRKFKLELKKNFPVLSEEDANSLIPNKDEVFVEKLATFSSDFVFVYIHQRVPLFFELDKDKILLPTVYTLWRYPELIPSFPTWPPVMDALANGADLMLPGVVVDHERGMKAFVNGKLRKGDKMGVNLVQNKAAIGVGLAFRSSEDLYMAGRRGKAVQVFHCYGDELWRLGTRETIPELGPPSGLEFLEGKTQQNETGASAPDHEEVGKLQQDVQVLQEPDKPTTPEVDEGDGHSGLAESAKGEASGTTVSDGPEGASYPRERDSVEEDEVGERSPQEEMDDLLKSAFLQAWKTTAKKAELPILTSNFFRSHMVPQCPASKPLDLKKSSYRKLSKFLAKMQDEEIIEVRELKKGIESITKVDLGHEAIVRHKVVAVEGSQSEDSKIAPCDRPYEPPEIHDLFVINSTVLPFFKWVKCSMGQGLTPTDVRKYVRQYVDSNGLQNDTDKTKVTLDPVLSNIVLSKNETMSELDWSKLNTRIQAKMSRGYSLTFPHSPTPLVHKGKLDPIEINTASRKGNKKVTLVYNLELFYIDPNQFARKCQVGVAASTSVHEAPNRRSGAIEVLVQGNQVKFVSKLLLQTYRIPRKYIRGLDEAPPKKK